MAEKLDLLAKAAKRVLVTGSMLRPRTARRKGRHADDLYEKVWPILSAGRCLPIIDKVFPLLSAAHAHRRMEAADHIGKIVLKVDEQFAPRIDAGVVPISLWNTLVKLRSPPWRRARHNNLLDL